MRDLTEWWTSDRWRTEAEVWIRGSLAAHGIRVTGMIEQPRIRCWSTQLVIPTSAGTHWFKENNPGQAFEAALVQALAELVPDRVVPPLAIEPARGWLLSPDAGRTLRALGTTNEATWLRVVAEFGRLQRDLVPHSARLRAAELPGFDPRQAVPYVAGEVERLAHLNATHPMHVTADRASAMMAGLPRLAEAAQQLVDAPVPPSLEHNDLHDNNAFEPTRGEPLRFFDLGDTVWGHPLASLLVPVDAIREAWGAGPDDPRVGRVVDAYLENWTDLAPLAELRALMGAAGRMGAVHRFESWRRLLAEVPIESTEGWVAHVPGWLERATA